MASEIGQAINFMAFRNHEMDGAQRPDRQEYTEVYTERDREGADVTIVACAGLKVSGRSHEPTVAAFKAGLLAWFLGNRRIGAV